LKRRLASDSSNSSKPPSSDAPWNKRPAKRRSSRERSGRKPGKHCDVRSHVVSEYAAGGRCDAEGVVQVSVRDLSRPWCASRVTAGCEARGKAQGFPCRPGATGDGKAGRANDHESSLMSRYGTSWDGQ
jgi:hypothetical protein